MYSGQQHAVGVPALLQVLVGVLILFSGTACSMASDSPTGSSFSQPEHIALPRTDVASQNEPVIDVEDVAQGYVVACASSASRLKFQIALGDQTYNYDLANDGTPEVFPLNMGNGDYLFRIMQNTAGNDYVELSATSCDVALDSEFEPYLRPNVFCAYDASSACVAQAREVTAEAANTGEAVRDVCEYVAATISYDNEKAQALSSSTGYVPDPDETLRTGSGICFDYASLACAMLRSMGIPTKIVTGYVGEEQIYHAWIMVYIDGTWHSAQFSVDPNTWSRCDVTFAATGSTEYVGDASAYTDRYVY